MIKERGTSGVFSAGEARAGGFLVSQLAATRRDVADLFGLPVEALHEAGPQAELSQVKIIEVRGGIDPMLSSFLQRQIARAVEAERSS